MKKAVNYQAYVEVDEDKFFTIEDAIKDPDKKMKALARLKKERAGLRSKLMLVDSTIKVLELGTELVSPNSLAL